MLNRPGNDMQSCCLPKGWFSSCHRWVSDNLNKRMDSIQVPCLDSNRMRETGLRGHIQCRREMPVHSLRWIWWMILSEGHLRPGKYGVVQTDKLSMAIVWRRAKIICEWSVFNGTSNWVIEGQGSVSIRRLVEEKFSDPEFAKSMSQLVRT